MPETAKPRAPESRAPDQGNGTASSAAARQQKRYEPVVWPRDLNAPSTDQPAWGSDPEALRDG
jgi:hypothetical protein